MTTTSTPSLPNGSRQAPFAHGVGGHHVDLKWIRLEVWIDFPPKLCPWKWPKDGFLLNGFFPKDYCLVRVFTSSTIWGTIPLMVFESLTSLVWSLVIDRTHAMVLLGPWGTTAISLRLQAYLEMSIGCMLITGYTAFLDHDIVFIFFNFNTPEIFLQNGPFQRPTQKTTYSMAKKSRPLRPKRHSQSRFEWPSPPLLQHQRALERPKKMGSLSDIWCRYLTTLHLKLVEPIWSNWNWKNQWKYYDLYCLYY